MDLKNTNYNHSTYQNQTWMRLGNAIQASGTVQVPGTPASSQETLRVLKGQAKISSKEYDKLCN